MKASPATPSGGGLGRSSGRATRPGLDFHGPVGQVTVEAAPLKSVTVLLSHRAPASADPWSPTAGPRAAGNGPRAYCEKPLCQNVHETCIRLNFATSERERSESLTERNLTRSHKTDNWVNIIINKNLSQKKKEKNGGHDVTAPKCKKA